MIPRGAAGSARRPHPASSKPPLSQFGAGRGRGVRMDVDASDEEVEDGDLDDVVDLMRREAAVGLEGPQD